MRILVGLLVAVTALVSGTPTARAAPRGCPAPPLEVTILPGPVGTTGPAPLSVTDAVARRVPIVPRPSGATGDPSVLERLRAKAAKTDLALYTMYLADFPVPRAELSGSGFGEVASPPGKTVAAVTIVPTARQGLRAGDVVVDEPFAYRSTTTFAPLSLVVHSSGRQLAYAYDDVEGSVKVRALTPKTICLDVDLAFTRNGQVVASAVGAARAPVVRSAPSFFYT